MAPTAAPTGVPLSLDVSTGGDYGLVVSGDGLVAHHADYPVIESVDVDGLGGAMNTTAREVLGTWLADYARNEPVYRLDDSLLQRLASRRVQSTEIDHGVVVMNLGN